MQRDIDTCKLWRKIKSNKYIRKQIFFDKKLNHNINTSNDESFFMVRYTEFDYLLSSKYLYSSKFFENIMEEKEEREEEYINSNKFRKDYQELMKIIYAIELLSSNDLMLLLSEIFNLCNVVAFDLEQKVIIILYDYKFYVIFYDHHKYIKLDYKNQINEIKSYIEYCKKEKLFEYQYSNFFYFDYVQNKVNEFLHSDMNFIFNYMKKKNNNNNNNNNILKSLIEYGKFLLQFPLYLFSSSSQLPSPLLTKQISTMSNPLPIELPDHVSQQHLSPNNVSELPIVYMRWIFNKEQQTYIRSCISLKRNLNVICKKFIENDNNYSQDICENLLIWNHLYIDNSTMIRNNVIYINFKKKYFTTLNIISDNICEFKNVSFLIFKYKGKSSNDLTIPSSNFVSKVVSVDKLYYYQLPF